ncbi:uncharacterized protein LOC121879948 isoform X2 [Homarus americanus]|uniref:Uncharacterized protein n=1 Tax=Homarus americanus TaxID=6706 RepID=A0A8J5MN44_HOMAM|nr:uncharacterized protein LOC121879948 isoform X2 [Homarus americanus]KAG7157551.1 hypothetical protein Hamer_G019185 [Homarus americanus]
MPPLRKLGSLTEICLECVWRWLHRCVGPAATTRNGRRLQTQYLVSALNSSLRQRLLIIICNIKTELLMESKCKLLQALGDNSTQWIDFSGSGSVFYDEIMRLYNTLCVANIYNLTRLGVVCDMKSRIDQKYISAVNSTFYWPLRKMSNLRWLTLGGVADGTILEILGANCHHLQYLDVSHSLKVDNDAVAAFLLKDPGAIQGWNPQQVGHQELPTSTTPCCTTLNQVCVSGTQVSMMGAVLLLRHVPQLRSLGGYIHDCSICQVIEILQPEGGVTQYKLNHLWDAIIRPRHTSLLNATCPSITAVTTCQASLPVLYLLQPLESLSVDVDFRHCTEALYDYLVVRGDTLRQLILTNSVYYPLDLACLIQFTPRLERVEATVTVKQEDINFPVWTTLKVASVKVENSASILALLTHTPDLRDLDLAFLEGIYTEETYESISDDLLLQILTGGGLKTLEKLRISRCMISRKGVNYLLLACPNLHYLAPLIFWPNVSLVDVEKLRARATQNNWVLRIVMRSDEE